MGQRNLVVSTENLEEFVLSYCIDLGSSHGQKNIANLIISRVSYPLLFVLEKKMYFLSLIVSKDADGELDSGGDFLLAFCSRVDAAADLESQGLLD